MLDEKESNSKLPTRDEILQILQRAKNNTESKEDRKKLKETFDAFKNKGQIEFVTFHQSYGYEEFIEGIKPNISDNENTQNGSMKYEITDGIFKRLCKKALKNYQDSNKQLEQLKQEITLDDILESYAAFIQEKIDNEEAIQFVGNVLKSKIQVRKINRFSNGKFRSIEIGTPSSSSTQSLTKDVIAKYYQGFKQGKLKDWRSIKPTNESQSAHHGNALYYFTLLEKLKEFEEHKYKPNLNFQADSIKLKPYILIIDEINRGNISKILGELITLIEPSKRIGESEELKLALPYSGESFGVPSNLYIIGTMNTADRSIALLDTALRRRFEFVEIMPQAELLKNIWVVQDKSGERDEENNLSKEHWLTIQEKEIKGNEYDNDESTFLFNVLESINNRIEFLLDREHTIGHSFFLERAEQFDNDDVGTWYELDFDDLRAIFANKIIPLLQEYFYDDYAKIIAVLNDNKMIESKSMKDLGVSINDDLVDSEKVVYRIAESSEWEAWQFEKIYDDKAARI